MKINAQLVVDTDNLAKLICELLELPDEGRWLHTTSRQDIAIEFYGSIVDVRKQVLVKIEKLLGIRQS